MRGWAEAREEKQRKYTHHRIKGALDRRVQEEEAREGGKEAVVAVMGSLFWLV